MSIELKIKAKHLALEPAIIRKEERRLLERIKRHKQYHQITAESADSLEPEVAARYLFLKGKRESLYLHRIQDVRDESRATHLARAFIKGTPYKRVENKTNYRFAYNSWNISRVMSRMIDMISKYGSKEDHVPKLWNRELNRHMYVTEDFNRLKAKVTAWLEAE